MLIKLWDWDKKWACTQVFEGHTHYVMQIVINPKDNNTFASASLDRTVKVSGLFGIEINGYFLCPQTSDAWTYGEKF
jgi:coatomer subunit beta'